MHEEASIIINGVPLTDADAMTLRVALESFASDMAEPDALGKDAHAKAMRKGYRDAIERIRAAMYEASK